MCVYVHPCFRDSSKSSDVDSSFNACVHLCLFFKGVLRIKKIASRELLSSMVVHLDDFLQYQHNVGMVANEGVRAIENVLKVLHGVIKSMKKTD
eukprot:m.31773 g.31773  ORF g.31773 m.31773 type:complete len:94 (-) comp9732_c0_seq1:72-353(-)